MLTVNTKQIRALLLLTISLFGLAAGYSTAKLSGWLLSSGNGDAQSVVVAPPTTAVAGSADIGVILAGNIFDPSARAIP